MNKTLKGWLICLVAACFFSYELIQLHMFNALSPMIIRDLHLSTTQFFFISSAYLLADVLLLIPAGLILDRISARKVILFSLCICIAGTFGMAVAKTPLQAGVFHFLSGIGNAFCFLSCMLLASSWFKQKSAFVMSIMITIGLLGGVLAQVPFTILSSLFGWRETLVFDALAGCFIWLLNYLIVEENTKEEKEKEHSSLFLQGILPAFSNIQVWKCGFYTGFLNLPLMIISALIGNLYLTNVLHFSSLHASLITSMISLGTIIGSPIYGLLSDLLQKKKPLMVFGAFASLLSFTFLFIIKEGSLFEMIALFFSLGFFSSSQVLGYPMIIESSKKSLKGTSMGLAAVIIMGLAFIGQPLTGFLIDLASTPNGYNFTYALMIFPFGFFISLLISLSVKEDTYRLAKTV